MTIKDKAIKGYLREVKQGLPGSAKGKRQILSSIQQSVENYLLENPDADWNAFQNHFGTPQQVADSYIENMETDEIIGKLKTKKIILRVVIGAAIVAILMWAICLTITLIQEKKAADGYYEVEIIETTEETK